MTGSTKGRKVISTCRGCEEKRGKSPVLKPKKEPPIIRLSDDGVTIEGQVEDVVITERGVENRDVDHPRKCSRSIARIRTNICKACKELTLDDNGEETLEPLKRVIDDVIYCGDPKSQKCIVDPIKNGCGKNIHEHAQWVQSQCPRKLWGPGRHFDSVVLPVYITTAKETIPDTFDFIGPARIADGNAIDCAGIGDTMMQGVIVQALHRINATQKINVRFTTVPQRMNWAELATAQDVDIIDLTDENRRVGRYASHSSPLRMVEMDATCEMHGWNRHQFFAHQFNIPFGEITNWKVKIEQEQLDAAAEFLKIPKRRGQPIVAVVPFANSSMRQWPIRHYHQLIERLKRQGVAVYVIDAPREKGHLVHRLPIRKFMAHNPDLIAAVVKQTDVLVGNDSGMAHLAGFVGTKALAICGVTPGPVIFGGWPSVEVLQAEGECTGCSWYQDNGYKPWCSWGCNLMHDLKPRTVEMRVMGLVGKKS